MLLQRLLVLQVAAVVVLGAAGAALRALLGAAGGLRRVYAIST